MSIELPQHIKDKLNSNDLNAIDTLVEDAEYAEFDRGYYLGLEHGEDRAAQESNEEGF